MLTLAADSARRDSLGAAARRRLTEAFTMERMIDDYAATYHRVMGA
jgi:hypothetical protein